MDQKQKVRAAFIWVLVCVAALVVIAASGSWKENSVLVYAGIGCLILAIPALWYISRNLQALKSSKVEAVALARPCSWGSLTQKLGQAGYRCAEAKEHAALYISETDTQYKIIQLLDDSLIKGYDVEQRLQDIGTDYGIDVQKPKTNIVFLWTADSAEIDPSDPFLTQGTQEEPGGHPGNQSYNFAMTACLDRAHSTLFLSPKPLFLEKVWKEQTEELTALVQG